MTFYYQSRYNRLFQQVAHKVGESEIKYIKIFQNDEDFSISVVNSYTEDQMMHTFLENFQQGGNYSANIEIHQEELKREKKSLIKNNYPYLTYRLII